MAQCDCELQACAAAATAKNGKKGDEGGSDEVEIRLSAKN